MCERREKKPGARDSGSWAAFFRTERVTFLEAVAGSRKTMSDKLSTDIKKFLNLICYTLSKVIFHRTDRSFDQVRKNNWGGR